MEGFNERIWNKMGEQSSRGLQLNITVRAADGRRGFVRIAYEHSLLSSEFRISRLNYQENKDTFSSQYLNIIFLYVYVMCHHCMQDLN